MTAKKISLGLQGGGAYAAFGWGVLDRLLEDEHFDIVAISGTSGGAINAAVLADGYAQGGGRAGARQALERFWRALGGASLFSPLQRTPFDYLTGAGSMQASPAYHLVQLMSAVLPPRATPAGMNPLYGLLASLIDFERVRSCTDISLFVPATNVRTGKAKIFLRDELDARKLAASACLPQVFSAAEIDGEACWDGSFVGNPNLSPLVDSTGAVDILIVQNNPIARSELPSSMADMVSRTSEIAFNISFVRELSALQHLGASIDAERTEQVQAAQVRLHLISGNATLSKLDISRKFNVEWPSCSGCTHPAGRPPANGSMRTRTRSACVRALHGKRSTIPGRMLPASERGGAAAVTAHSRAPRRRRRWDCPNNHATDWEKLHAQPSEPVCQDAKVVLRHARLHGGRYRRQLRLPRELPV